MVIRVVADVVGVTLDLQLQRLIRRHDIRRRLQRCVGRWLQGRLVEVEQHALEHDVARLRQGCPQVHQPRVCHVDGVPAGAIRRHHGPDVPAPLRVMSPNDAGPFLHNRPAAFGERIAIRLGQQHVRNLGKIVVSIESTVRHDFRLLCALRLHPKRCVVPAAAVKFRSGERRQIRKVSLIGRDFLGRRRRRGERQSKRQRRDFDHVQTKEERRARRYPRWPRPARHPSRIAAPPAIRPPAIL